MSDSTDRWFLKCCAFTFPQEGEFYADPRGGPTNLGVTQAELNAFRVDNHLRPLAVEDLDVDGAKAIYLVDYYWRAQCEKLGDWRLAVAIFDAAVNCGVYEATKLLQAALGLDTDGMFGPRTQVALRQVKDFTAVVLQVLLKRDEFYEAINDPRFTNGWLARVDKLAHYLELDGPWAALKKLTTV